MIRSSKIEEFLPVWIKKCSCLNFEKGPDSWISTKRFPGSNSVCKATQQKEIPGKIFTLTTAFEPGSKEGGGEIISAFFELPTKDKNPSGPA